VQKLFVYGTLRRNGSAAHLMRGAEFVNDASLRGMVVHRNGFPGLIPGDSLVPGELFDVPDAMLDRLDQYEGPGYTRNLTEVQCGSQTIKAWVYWLA
jgi:gamma-glutamylcyclotransferase (GGCT)/AIG2-like uncharacterized protein YtfP